MTQTLSSTGEFQTVDVGGATQRLDPYLIPTNGWPVVLRRPDADETAVITIPETIGVVDTLPVPQPHDPRPVPNPAPAPRIDPGALQPIAPLERVLFTGELPIIVDVSDRQAHAAPQRARWGFRHGRHRRPSMLSRLFGGGR